MPAAVAAPLRARRPRGAVALGACLCLALAGCVGPSGPAEPPAAPRPEALGERWPAVTAQLDAARSVSVTARWADPAATVSLSGSLEAGGAYRGSATDPEGTVEVVHAGDVTYLRGDGGEASLAEVDPGSWLALPGAADALVSPAELVQRLRDGLPEELPARDGAVGGHEVTVDGERLERFAGVRLDDGGPVDLYLDDEDRLARLARPAAGGTGSSSGTATADGGVLPAGLEEVDFDDWDAVPEVRAPAEADVWDRPGL